MILAFLKKLLSKHKCIPRPNSANNASVSFYELTGKTIKGEDFNFSQLKGKKVLIVNTASKCGYTGQYAQLEDLHRLYKEKLIVLGFPCNDFLGQEPEGEAKIMEFCSINYGVSFQLFEKITLKGAQKSPIYEWLSNTKLNGWNETAPIWNFCKYLIDEKGELALYASPAILPTDKEFIRHITS
jgi:glutathione peroxidase